MTKSILLLVLILSPLITFSATDTTSSDWSTEVSTRKIYGSNFVGVEALGRGVAYSINYDRAINSRFSLGSGFSYYQWGVAGYNVDMAFLPLYAQYYFSGGPTHRAFVTGGATLMYAKSEIRGGYFDHDSGENVMDTYAKAEGTSVEPNAGIGYEFRSKSNFTLRVTTYAQYLSYLKTVLAWGGISAGVQF